jgi:phosphate transport system permease protein
MEKGTALATEAPPRPRASLSGKRRSEGVARSVAWLGAAALLAVLAYMLLRLVQASMPMWRAHGLGWLFARVWAPSEGVFGALPFIFGTLVTSAVALALATPVALGTALFVSELAPARIRRPIANVLDLLAAVPSVIYGLWGILVLVPLLRPVQTWMGTHLSVLPVFSGPVPGPSFLTAGIVLAVMILPTISAVSREVFVTVPRDVREAAYALGSTRWEAIRLAVLPPARTGIVGGVILGLGRALGETIAVTMVIGNSAQVTRNLLSPGASMASVIAQEFTEALEPLHRPALIGVALALFVVVILVDIGARLLVRRTRARTR